MSSRSSSSPGLASESSSLSLASFLGRAHLSFVQILHPPTRRVLRICLLLKTSYQTDAASLDLSPSPLPHRSITSRSSISNNSTLRRLRIITDSPSIHPPIQSSIHLAEARGVAGVVVITRPFVRLSKAVEPSFPLSTISKQERSFSSAASLRSLCLMGKESSSLSVSSFSFRSSHRGFFLLFLHFISRSEVGENIFFFLNFVFPLVLSWFALPYFASLCATTTAGSLCTAG